MTYSSFASLSLKQKGMVCVTAIAVLVLVSDIAANALSASAASKKTVSISKTTQQRKKDIIAAIKKRRANVHKTKSVVRYFTLLSNGGRKVKKNPANLLSPAKLYSRAMPVLSPTVHAAQTLNIDAPAPEDDPTAIPLDPIKITKEEWFAHAPQGPLYEQANWFCSAAGTTLSYILPDATLQSLGFFTGDCTNINNIGTGTFYPQKLGTFSPDMQLNFEIDSNGYGDVKNTTDTAGVCDIVYYKSFGDKDVYAIQYTCDDGYKIGLRNDIQYTIFAFPPTWQEPPNTENLLKNLVADADKDGMISRLEQQVSTDPNKADTDGDGLKDGDEYYAYLTSPLAKDTDGDKVDDKTEVDNLTNPLGPGNATAEQVDRWSRLKVKVEPILSDISVSVDSETATVSWTLNIPSDGIVNYGETTAYGTHYSDYAFTKNHAIAIPVSSGKTYHYAIRSCSLGPNAVCTSTADMTFTTP